LTVNGPNVYGAYGTHICGISQEDFLVSFLWHPHIRMKKYSDTEKTGTYAGKETPGYELVGVSFVAPGMETRISAAADAIGTRTKAAAAMGVSSDSLQRYIRGENSPPFDAIVRLCSASRTRLEWMAWDTGPMEQPTVGDAQELAAQSQSHPLRHEELTIAIQLVEEALEGKTLETAKRAELVALVYEGLVDGMPEAIVLRWARAAAK
jgi:hypothetical protein